MSQPNDWQQRMLRDVTLQTATWNPLREARDRIRYVDVSGVDRATLRIIADTPYSAAEAPSRARKVVLSGDTIFATVRPTLRRIAQIPRSLDGEIVSTAFCVLRPDPNQLDSDFLFFATQLDSVMSGISALETGATYPAVRDSDVLDQTIPVPRLAEQQEIAAALKATRSAPLHESNCEVETFALKRAAMRALFTKGLRGEAQKDTEIGMVPESWDIAQIGDVSLNTQYGLSVRGQPSGAYPILRMNCQEDGAVHYRNLQYVDLDEATFEAFRLRPGDLLFNRTNSIDLVGRMAIIDDERPAVFASYLVRLTVDEARCDPCFLNYFMNWPETQSEIKKLASRAVGQANINASKLRTVLFPLPSTLDEQREIVAVLDAIDRKIDLHKRKRAVLEELFKSLLHKLMTGEIRVADLDLSVLASTHLPEEAA